MSPLEIRILLHCYAFCEPWSHMDNAAHVQIFGHLEEEGLIELSDKSGYYNTTSRGSAHVEQLCQLPWPMQAWVDSNGKVIGEFTP